METNHAISRAGNKLPDNNTARLLKAPKWELLGKMTIDMANNKLELTWYGKESEIGVEPRILLEDKDLSYSRPSGSLLEDDIMDNLLIHGDNLLALKALEQDYAGKIKCIYIDPPYNTGAAFSTYDDNLEHSKWLSLMKPRLEMMRRFLSEDGSLWISIDSEESHYLKVLLDEIFGRGNFVEEIVWQRSYAPINLKKLFSRNHDYILVYCKNSTSFKINLLPRNSKTNSGFSNPDDDPRGPWASGPIQCGPRNENRVYPITCPSGRVVLPPPQYCWRYSQLKFNELVADGRIYFGPDGDNVPRVKRFLSEVKQGVVPLSLWLRDEVGDNQEAKKEIKALFASDVFDTPKPERLIKRILELATLPGDWVLDSFLGSGTTAAVAHKMGRHWIGVELTDSAYIHCQLRLKKVIDTKDSGGITKEVGWQGGGGYRFYELAPTLVKEDSFGQPVINEDYSPEMLAAAVAKHEGYRYDPDKDCYWKQSRSEANSYLYVTTQHVGEEAVQNILDGMQEYEFLLIVCKSFDSGILSGLDKRISIKRIPQSLLNNCEFGVDNYNLNIVCPPEYEEDGDDE